MIAPYVELRKFVQSREKYPCCKRVDRSPLINEGFPGSFNISFTEPVWLREYGRYIDFDHDFNFSTIQSCIRPSDLPLIKTENSWKYLGVFEMADVTGSINLANKSECINIQAWQISGLIQFLEECGISKDRLYASHSIGGTVTEVTKKYGFDFKIPEDAISKNAFLAAGVREENIIRDMTRDTFLSLHLYRPTLWGYRNEVFVNIGLKNKPNLLDIATVEYFLWKPKFCGEANSANICGLEENKNDVLLNVIGLERLCMAVNGLERIQEVDYIAPFYQTLKKIQKCDAFSVGENLRALHRIYSDINSYKCSLSKQRKKRIRKILQNIPSSISLEHIKELLETHSETQPWHSNLQEGIAPTIDRIVLYRRT